MRVKRNWPPRTFNVGKTGTITLSDMGLVFLDPDEQLTFATDSGTEFDVARKNFGYYATPSLNGRLPAKGLRPALTRNEAGRFYVLLVEAGREAQFEHYLKDEEQTLVAWLDEATLQAFAAFVANTSQEK
ncbi:MAG: hypothetical protein CMF69_06650 [Magnetovibrio sp.]|nr:hypothetical protein [Magnetovibrio sp.]|tara:strand:+ start:793 stop:1182 length:390 start_codon:yes stop_codon:yes gene_type:complete